MRYYVLLLITFLILVPTALAQEDDWTEYEADDFTVRLPEEWESASLNRSVGEILAFERGPGGRSRLSVVTIPLDEDVNLNDDFRRDMVQDVESSGGDAQDSDVTDTSSGNAIWVRFRLSSSDENGLSYIIADADRAYKFTLLEEDAITTQDQAMMERIIDTVEFENPRSDGAFEAGRDFGEWLGRFFWICCCCLLIPFLAFNAYLYWERRKRQAEEARA